MQVLKLFSYWQFYGGSYQRKTRTSADFSYLDSNDAWEPKRPDTHRRIKISYIVPLTLTTNFYMRLICEYPVFKKVNNYFSFVVSIPEVISDISLVMAAWRCLLNCRFKSCATSPALSVAFFMATIRAECSDALDSNRA